jgi:DNA-binding CsgD family transcriptional regulator/tetratricopeptide (TPR) repeat protein
VKVLSVKQLAARLNDAYRLLTVGNRTALPRQQTLRATIEWSYNLLSKQEQIIFCRLCVFAGGCTLETAEAVCAGDGIEEKQVLELLSHLIDQSLVHMQELSGDARYGMPEIIQQFGREQLEAKGEAVILSRRHRDWYLGLAEQTEQGLAGKRQGVWLDRLEAEHDNLRCALRWSLEQKEAEVAARLGVSLWPFWMIRGYVSEGRQWMERTLAQLHGNTVLRAEVLRIAGILTGHQGENSTRAMRLLEESLDVWRTVGDTKGIASVLIGLGMGAQKLGDYEQATARHEECLSLLRTAGNIAGTALALSSLGLTLFYRGDHERATSLCEESLSLRRAVGDKGGSAHTLTILGRVAFAQNNYEQAAAFYRESLLLRQESGEREGVAAALEGLAAICGARGEAMSAARLLGAAEAQRESTALVIPPPDHAFNERIRATIGKQLSMRDLTTARAEGRSFTLEQVLALQEQLTQAKQSQLHAPFSSSTYPNELTVREVEVLHLVAQGLSDAMVAEQLVISPRTVQGHVRSIFNKIHVNSRSAATRFALEHKLV